MSARISELQLPRNKRSGLAAALWGCRAFAGGITDILIHENDFIRVKSARGVIPLQSLGIPGSDLKVTAADIQHFFASFVDNRPAHDDATAYWQGHIEPRLASMEPIYRSIELADDGHDVAPPHLRVALFRHRRGQLAMTARLITPPRQLREVGLPPALVDRLQANPKGLLILTGPTGSGKTNTALAILSSLNQTMSGHIVTIEDPIELPLPSHNCMVTQREVGVDVGSFAEGLREALRQSPEAILAGEVRDRDAAETAILGGESGSLMLVTTHGRSVLGTLRKLLALCGDSAAMRTVLAGSLIGVVRLDLLPLRCGDGYVLVNDTLFGTPEVRRFIEQGDWATLEQLCLREDQGPNFHAMRCQVDQLARENVIDKGVATRAVGARRGAML